MKPNHLKQCLKSELSLHLKKGQSLTSSLNKVKNYFKEDREKFISVLLIILFPVSSNVYLLVPDIYVPYYEQLDFLVFSLSESVGHILVASAWFITIKDRVFQYLPFLAILFACYQIIAKIPIVQEVPVWLEITSCLLFAYGILVTMFKIKRVIITSKVQKINHGILQHTSRLRALPGIGIPEEQLRQLIETEAKKAEDCARGYLDLYQDKEEFDEFYIK